MNQVEDRLASLLTRAAEAVEVHHDIDQLRDAEPLIPVESGSSHGSRRRLPVLVVGAAGAVALVVAALLTADSGPDGVEVDSAADSARETQPIDTIPRILVGADGWEISYVDEPSRDFGETTYRNNAGQVLLLSRYTAEEYGYYVENRGAAGPGLDRDHRRSRGGRLRASLLERQLPHGAVAGRSVQLRAPQRGFVSRADFEAVLAAVAEVDETTAARTSRPSSPQSQRSTRRPGKRHCPTMSSAGTIAPQRSSRSWPSCPFLLRSTSRPW